MGNSSQTIATTVQKMHSTTKASNTSVTEKTICHYLLDAQKRDSSLVAMKYKKNRIWRDISWQEFYSQTENVAASLQALGAQKGDRVVLLANTRPEWLICDLGIMSLGAVTVPVYPSSRIEEVDFILNDSKPTILFLENASQVKKWMQLENKPTSVKKVICIEPYSQLPDEMLDWQEFLDEGTDLLTNNSQFLSDSIAQRNVSEIASLVYTSGTTGFPKGVVVIHQQIVSEVCECFDLFNINTNDLSLTFLPYSHVLGRVEAWGSIYTGFTLAFAESIEKIRVNITEVQPTLLMAVPRIFEKIYVAIITQVEAHPVKAKLFNWALRVGKNVSRYKARKKNVPIPTLVQYRMAKKLVFDPILEKLGGRMRFAISGGAPLEKEIAEFFHAAGLPLLEGYGLTETTAAICVNTPLNYKFGTVGRPVGDVEIKIAEDGEVLVKSNKVMKEYYNNPDATAEVFVDGYFATGDIGNFTDDGYLKITDRKKDLIKTSGGKYIAPQKLENLLKLNRLVSNVLIHGDKKKYVVALITLDEVETLKYAKENHITYQNYANLTQLPEIKKEVQKAIAETNQKLASFETIKNFTILKKDFTIEAGELTPSLKVKRKICDERYKNDIEALY